MNSTLRTVTIIIVTLAVIAGVRLTIDSVIKTDNKQMTRSEYIEKATNNCAKDGVFTESECRCMYTALAKKYTVTEMLEMDKAAYGNSDYTSPQDVVDTVKVCL